MSATVEWTDDGLLAAEYVLGVLEWGEMRGVEARAASDPAFASEIQLWEQRLASLRALVVPTPPPPVLWARLALATGIGGGVAVAQGRRRWQIATGASLALAACLAGLLLLPRTGLPPERFAAALTPLGSPARFLAEIRPNGSLSIAGLGGQAAPAGRDYQLWAVPQGATAPLSLGVLPPGGMTLAKVPGAPGAQLLVSLEPTGGSPTGAPTGPVVLGGTLQPVRP